MYSYFIYYVIVLALSENIQRKNVPIEKLWEAKYNMAKIWKWSKEKIIKGLFIFNVHIYWYEDLLFIYLLHYYNKYYIIIFIYNYENFEGNKKKSSYHDSTLWFNKNLKNCMK